VRTVKNAQKPTFLTDGEIMEDLKIDEALTICAPDSDGDVEIEIDDGDYSVTKYVKFADLETWVAKIKANSKGYRRI
jgi:hypothetical protein